mmetsp:Transcript_6545/g.11294  ORF Transcript_6545/g.11294 Transcript_6545/m.11294 type:complete len:194 (+) Transcript_6545:69-650(+)|eukprot:CAMPEP_0196657780 /NCGR_PEP_ID=MMETSP1086-20130531/25485_1 /TAXON_ID=77921 /ORGANISM="Cyanoptyche  gloeocystis , Strain SAG4.97" /LENGTH=193 /DNA_ID=CAMNT_0041991049 /DNA_START=61 /DNA_END=642 /DNA_ORIENTATION=+
MSNKDLPVNGGEYINQIDFNALGPALGMYNSEVLRQRGPDYVFAEDYGEKKRSWGEQLTFYTGMSYATGLFLGGSFGFVSAVRKPAATTKLKMNAIFNRAGRLGARNANRLGVLAFMYSGLDSTIGYMRGEEDEITAFAAGATTGLIFKGTAGLRTALSAGIFGGCVALLVSKYASYTSQGSSATPPESVESR